MKEFLNRKLRRILNAQFDVRNGVDATKFIMPTFFSNELPRTSSNENALVSKGVQDI